MGLLLACAVLFFVLPAGAAAPICNEFAQSDIAPAPMMPAVIGSIRAPGTCDDALGFERAPAPQDPESKTIDLPLRAVLTSLAWQKAPSARLELAPAASGGARAGFAPGVFRPPCA